MKFSLVTALLLGYASAQIYQIPDLPDFEIPGDTEEIEVNEDAIPTAMFHGLGDMCINPGIGQIDRVIAKGTGGKVECIEVGLPSVGEVLNNAQHVAEVSCDKIAKNPIFKGEFNVIGLSQGGLFARYIVEECKMPGKVRNMVTIGGPHMGVSAVPHCFHGFICDILNNVIDHIVYMKLAQQFVVPAGYFRNTKDMEHYKKGSVFLPALNNELDNPDAAAADRKARFSALNGAMLVMFEKDTMIYPKETAWFQSLDAAGEKVLPLDQTDFYNKDYIGVKTLDDAKKITKVSWPGDHL